MSCMGLMCCMTRVDTDQTNLCGCPRNYMLGKQRVEVCNCTCITGPS